MARGPAASGRRTPAGADGSGEDRVSTRFRRGVEEVSEGASAGAIASGRRSGRVAAARRHLAAALPSAGVTANATFAAPARRAVSSTKTIDACFVSLKPLM